MRKLTQEQFLDRCRAAHGSSLDFTETVYLSGLHKVTVRCARHGLFTILPSNLLKPGSGCPGCGRARAASGRANDLAAFLQKSRAAHGERYDYSGVIYTRSTALVQIVCPEHGAFHQVAAEHLRGYGCQRCGDEERGRAAQHTTSEFIARCKAVHGERYRYDAVVYRGIRHPVTLTCPEHGDFEQLPQDHWNGAHCPRCAFSDRGIASRSTREEFIEGARQEHGERYGYEDVIYTLSNRKVAIRCPQHGLFEQTPSNHLSGYGCPLCGFEETGKRLRHSPETFLALCHEVHGDRYDYSRAVYKGVHDRVEIICATHGVFEQKPADHINQETGCPRCATTHSRPHKEVEQFLTNQGITFLTNDRTRIAPRELDIVFEGQPIAIEFNGTWWHSLTAGNRLAKKMSHRNKFLACQQQGLSLFQIDEHEWGSPLKREIWQSILLSKTGRHRTRIPARKTTCVPLSSDEANRFLRVHHLQGRVLRGGWNFALKYENEIVGVIVFCMHQRRCLNLVRLAFAKGVTVLGGASKLFRHALKHLPALDIVTFSNNRYSSGAVYPQLGFHKDTELPPSYQWVYKGAVLNKRLCRHQRLPKLLGESYDPALTENQNMFRAGARILYDAGYVRWSYSVSP